MPVETWFPSVIFFEDFELESALRDGVLEAVREKTAQLMETTGGQVTASNASNDLHLDTRVAALFGVFGAAFKEFFISELGIDPDGAEFYVGRCWPVIQSEEGFPGGPHVHHGAVFSGVFYLEVPEGSGALQFSKSNRSPYDHLDKREFNSLNYQTTEYPAQENRLIVFSSDLVHRRLPKSSSGDVPRTAIAFDIYSMVDIKMKGGGMPHYELLRRVV
jgi:uncharacterized protein (TIGR02466 family)